MTSSNPFLSGNFAPVKEETDRQLDNVIGAIPTDLDGCFLRNGPNPQFDPPNEKRYHWFDGDGMIHEVAFADGKAVYRNKWIVTRGLEIERQEGKALWKGYLSPPDFNNKYGMPAKNLANTALVWHADRLLALWEAGSPHEVSLPDLTTTGIEDFGGQWKYPVSAHPKVCPETGEMITFCYNPMGNYQVHYGVVDSDGKVIHHAGITLKGKPVMIHDLAITRNHSIIMDMPVTFDLQRAMKGGFPFEWEPENGCRMGILPRFGTNDDVQWFDVEVGYIFHVLNAWEEGDDIVLEGCRAAKTTVISIQRDEDDNGDDEKGRPHQYRFNLNTGAVTEKPITDVAMEFTRINESYVGRKNRFAYGSRFSTATAKPVFDAVIKMDREQNTLSVVELGPDRFTGEFVFAPRVGSAAEDDGYYIGFVRDEQAGQSECWVIDARRFADGPVARIVLPVRVPYGFHAHWVDGEAIRHQHTRVAKA